MLTKQGKRGTMYAYRCAYIDRLDYPYRQCVHVWGYNTEHAQHRAVDHLLSMGFSVDEFTLVKVERVQQ